MRKRKQKHRRPRGAGTASNEPIILLVSLMEHTTNACIQDHTYIRTRSQTVRNLTRSMERGPYNDWPLHIVPAST